MKMSSPLKSRFAAPAVVFLLVVVGTQLPFLVWGGRPLPEGAFLFAQIVKWTCYSLAFFIAFRWLGGMSGSSPAKGEGSPFWRSKKKESPDAK